MQPDQRADTPRTAAGREMLRICRAFDMGYPSIVDRIVAIEAEAAAEPAAVEPPAVTVQRIRDLLDERGWRPDTMYAILTEVAAQPPRGSLPDDVTHFRGTIREVAPNPVIIEGGSLPDHGLLSEDAHRESHAPSLSWYPHEHGDGHTHAFPLAGGSLTATEPPIAGYWEVEPDHDVTPEEMEGMQAVLEDAVAKGLQLVTHHGIKLRWRPVGSPRGVTPALDVERLARAMRRVYRGAPEHDSLALGDAELIAAEYARLGSPEDSDAV